MSSISLAHLPLVRARNLRVPRTDKAAGQIWSFENMKGRLVELSQEKAHGATSVAARLIVEAQNRGEPVVWVAGTGSIFFPPDFARAGIKLETLTVVWARGLKKTLVCVEILMRSGAFGLLIADIGVDCGVSDGSLGRLVKLAELHAAALVFLTVKNVEMQSLGSMISLRAAIRRTDTRLLESELHILKDKRDKPGTVQRMTYYGPPGMY